MIKKDFGEKIGSKKIYKSKKFGRKKKVWSKKIPKSFGPNIGFKQIGSTKNFSQEMIIASKLMDIATLGSILDSQLS